MKGKIILYIASSIDGYIADSSGGIDWLNEGQAIVEEDNSYEKFYENIDVVILGRKTYDQVVEELSPGNYPYKDKTSYVITNRLENDNTEDNIVFTNENLIDLVEKLKLEGKRVWIVGGSSIIHQLVDKDLIDEYEITMIPKILGSGIPLFKEVEESISLELVSSYFRNGICSLKYRRV